MSILRGMKRKQRILIAGKNGLVSSALFEYLSKFEDYEVSSHGRSTVDFCVRDDTFRLIEESKPDWILLSSAKVGGIQANQSVDRLKRQLGFNRNS